MVIKILGKGCPRCKQLEENARKAVESSGIKAEIEKITDINTITEYGIMMTPALVVDGIVKSSGRLLSPDEIKKLLQKS